MKYIGLAMAYIAGAFISYKLAVHLDAITAYWIMITGYAILIVNAYFENR